MHFYESETLFLSKISHGTITKMDKLHKLDAKNVD